MIGRNVPMMNENGVANLLLDIDFLEDEFKRGGHAHLNAAFLELRLVSSVALPLSSRTFPFIDVHIGHLIQMTTIVMEDQVQQYLIPAVRQASYSVVRPKRLQALLEKLARYGAECRDAPSRERGEKRRKEAETVGRLFPGESR